MRILIHTLNSHRLALLIGIFILLVIAPFVLDKSWISIFTEILIMALAGCAVNIIIGYSGMIHFGAAGLYAVGAYTTAILLTRYHFPWALGLVAGPFFAAIVGAVVGWFCVRRSAVYFSLLTLAFSQLIWTIIFQWYDFTGGDNGIASIPIPEFFFSTTNCFYFTLAVSGACIGVIWMILQSPFGKTIQAIRENSGRAEFIAIYVKRYQLSAFVLSSFFLGVAGSLYCLFSGSVFPDYAHWVKGTDMILVCLLGGVYHFVGPIVGSFVYILLTKFIAKQTMYWMFFLGAIVVFLVLFMRNGIVGFTAEKLSQAIEPAAGMGKQGENQ